MYLSFCFGFTQLTQAVTYLRQMCSTCRAHQSSARVDEIVCYRFKIIQRYCVFSWSSLNGVDSGTRLMLDMLSATSMDAMAWVDIRYFEPGAQHSERYTRTLPHSLRDFQAHCGAQAQLCASNTKPCIME